MSLLHPHATDSPYKQVSKTELQQVQQKVTALRAAGHTGPWQADPLLTAVLPQGYRVDKDGVVKFYGDTGLGAVLTYAPYVIGAAGLLGGVGAGAGAAPAAAPSGAATLPANVAALEGGGFGWPAAVGPTAKAASFWTNPYVFSNLIGTGAQVGLGIYGAKVQSNASKYAADRQAEASAAELAYLKEQAAIAQKNWEAAQAQNYAQWRWTEETLTPYRQGGSNAQATLNDLLGGRQVSLPPIPDYQAMPPPSSTQSGPPPNVSADKGDIGKQVTDYFAARGVQPFPTSVASWQGYWDDWGAKDPEYFNRRLAQADEFTGGPPASSVRSSTPPPSFATPPTSSTPSAPTLRNLSSSPPTPTLSAVAPSGLMAMRDPRTGMLVMVPRTLNRLSMTA